MDVLESLPGFWVMIAGLAAAFAGLRLTRTSWRAERPSLRILPRMSRKAPPEATKLARPVRLTSQTTWTKLSRVIEDAVHRADVIQSAQRASALQIDAAELALRRLLTEARLVVRHPIVMFDVVPVASEQHRPRSAALAA